MLYRCSCTTSRPTSAMRCVRATTSWRRTTSDDTSGLAAYLARRPSLAPSLGHQSGNVMPSSPWAPGGRGGALSLRRVSRGAPLTASRRAAALVLLAFVRGRLCGRGPPVLRGRRGRHGRQPGRLHALYFPAKEARHVMTTAPSLVLRVTLTRSHLDCPGAVTVQGQRHGAKEGRPGHPCPDTGGSTGVRPCPSAR